jgi:hypothetical protein
MPLREHTTIELPELRDLIDSGVPALSLKALWAWFVVHYGKNIENRPRRSHRRGPILIHASSSMTRKEYQVASGFASGVNGHPRIPVPSYEEMPSGGIVGYAEITDCVTESDSHWFIGPFGYVLKNVRPVSFTPAKGALGFFKPTLTP